MSECNNYVSHFGLKNIHCLITLLDNYKEEEWGIPRYENDGDAGFDLRTTEYMFIPSLVTISRDEDYVMSNHDIAHTGIKMVIPEGYQLEIRPRSGLAAKCGLTVANTPGTIDSGYRGEIKVILINLGIKDMKIERGTRIAQAVLMPVVRAKFSVVGELPESERGEGGFGSTGLY